MPENNNNEPQTPSAAPRYLNASAVKAHALACSKQIRAGTFTRVGESFETDINIEVETIVRKLRGMFQPPVHAVVDHAKAKFVTGELMDKLREELDACVARCVQAKVQRHPSIGCTLKGA